MSERPKPFSSAWLTAPELPPEPPRRINKRASERLVSALSWLPGERVLSVLVVLFLILTSFWFATPPGGAHRDMAVADGGTPVAGLVFDEADQPDESEASISMDSFTVTEGDEDDEANVAGATREAVDTEMAQGPKLTLNLPQKPEIQNGSLLPQYRLLMFYGFPGNPNMGILGEYDKDRLLEMMRDQAAEYEAADPSRPVKVAFEVIASVAQPESQADGSWLLDTPSSVLDNYTDFAAENDVLVFFDVQIGRRTVSTEVEGLRPWLEKPFVHLALDPEFAMRDDQIPGDDIGQIDGSDVTWTQNYLAGMSRDTGIPPKVLIVHQFKHSMIENKDTMEPVEGVQLVIDMDGFGSPELKRSTYTAVISQEPIEYHGVKLFYEQDKPLMSPEEILELDPVPDLIIYQ